MVVVAEAVAAVGAEAVVVVAVAVVNFLQSLQAGLNRPISMNVLSVVEMIT